MTDTINFTVGTDDINFTVGTDTFNITATGPLSSIFVNEDVLLPLNGADGDTGIKYNSSNDRVEIVRGGAVKYRF